jgi:dynactin complex subunit
LDNDSVNGFKQRFQPVFDKLGVNDQVIEKREKKIIQKKQEDQQDANKRNFFIMAAIAIAVSAFIAFKFSDKNDDLVQGMADSRGRSGDL